jgi:DNA-binding PadR family transcriptional regulator
MGMTDSEALIRFSAGQDVNQATVARLVGQGLANAADGTNFDSGSRELLLVSITEKGRKHLQQELKIVDQHISDLRKQSPCDQRKMENLTFARRRIEDALR